MKEMHLKQLKRLSPLGVLLITLAGCGQSGPLYLPEDKAEPNKPQQVTTPVTQTQSSTIESKQDQ
ncbi:lipoprotein [Pseudoalteromonas sp. SG43-7]|jgi:predicted small lipoprotein YifL|uniref:Lipoprotein n=1 Tax=Pseudoalteromonas neustonica TaxID=1840331 RepID=A0ABY3FCN4_9GAMM|nr:MULTISPECIES: lipoprotein [Pseudoalteromonas]MBB1292480.1 lipoprotein [Pseudoalteromonas sp. SR41-4]MBB1332223.1 lipoprotein [Pseudoalteromonas sp. SR41-6]MBB1399761.1 lipoprotein [Pseudoalteromonas sp. SG44-8]MBB1416129.1 lipoprotein [Pseudoalteromonas sp. SG44-1]MBB1421005.1 lipoprotein [Pseudoalteromonas sp. SG43-7]